MIKSMTDMEAKKQAQIQMIKQQILAKQQGKPLMTKESAAASMSASAFNQGKPKMFSPLIGQSSTVPAKDPETSDQNSSDLDNLSSEDIKSIVNSEKRMFKQNLRQNQSTLSTSKSSNHQDSNTTLKK